MTTTNRISLRQSVNRKCRECIYDPLSRGAWREQVAACISAHCALHPVRPLPRSCTVGGQACADRIAALRAKLEA